MDPPSPPLKLNGPGTTCTGLVRVRSGMSAGWAGDREGGPLWLHTPSGVSLSALLLPELDCGGRCLARPPCMLCGDCSSPRNPQPFPVQVLLFTTQRTDVRCVPWPMPVFPIHGQRIAHHNPTLKMMGAGPASLFPLALTRVRAPHSHPEDWWGWARILVPHLVYPEGVPGGK